MEDGEGREGRGQGQINAVNLEDRAGSAWIASHKGQNRQ